MLNLASILDYSAYEYPEKAAIISGEQKITFAQLNTYCNKIANVWLRPELARATKLF